MHQGNLHNERFVQSRLDGLLQPALAVSLGLHLLLWFGVTFFQPTAPKAAIPVWIEMTAAEAEGMAASAMAAMTKEQPGSRSDRGRLTRHSVKPGLKTSNRIAEAPARISEPARDVIGQPQLAMPSPESFAALEPSLPNTGTQVTAGVQTPVLASEPTGTDGSLVGAGRENGGEIVGRADVGGTGTGNSIGTVGGQANGDGRILLPYSYFQKILTRIESTKRYPRFAKERGLEGKVHLEFVIGGDGRIKDLKVISTSGFQILDQDAVATLRRAGPFPPVPGRSAAEKIAVRLAITYQLITEPR